MTSQNTGSGPGPEAFAPGWATSSGLVQRFSAADVGDADAGPALALTNLVNLYALGVDERDYELLGELFAPDAVWTGVIAETTTLRYEGVSEIVEFLRDSAAAQQAQRRHLALNPIVRPAPRSESAGAAAIYAQLLIVEATPETGTKPVTSGFYSATARKAEGRWLFDTFVAGFDSPF